MPLNLNNIASFKNRYPIFEEDPQILEMCFNTCKVAKLDEKFYAINQEQDNNNIVYKLYYYYKNNVYTEFLDIHDKLSIKDITAVIEGKKNQLGLSALPKDYLDVIIQIKQTHNTQKEPIAPTSSPNNDKNRSTTYDPSSNLFPSPSANQPKKHRFDEYLAKHMPHATYASAYYSHDEIKDRLDDKSLGLLLENKVIAVKVCWHDNVSSLGTDGDFFATFSYRWFTMRNPEIFTFVYQKERLMQRVEEAMKKNTHHSFEDACNLIFLEDFQDKYGRCQVSLENLHMEKKNNTIRKQI